MFYAKGFEAPKNHIDFAFQNTDDWTVVGSNEGSPPSLWIMLGDPVSGPAIQLGTCPPLDESIWIDTHYHATDQYRCVMSGHYLLQRKKNMKCGDFTFHKSGVPYREGPAGGSADPLWIVSVHGDKRGARSTATRHDATFPLVVGEDQLDGKVGTGLVDDPYWDTVPGGAKGKTAIAVTAGRSVGGFTWGNFDDREDWQALGDGVESFFAMFGDVDSGPFVMTARAQGGALLVPALECASEIAIFVVSGSVEIGGKTYVGGEVRIQSASVELPAVIAGAQGADISVMIADRRADIATDDSEWLERVLEAKSDLTQSALEKQAPGLSGATNAYFFGGFAGILEHCGGNVGASLAYRRRSSLVISQATLAQDNARARPDAKRPGISARPFANLLAQAARCNLRRSITTCNQGLPRKCVAGQDFG